MNHLFKRFFEILLAAIMLLSSSQAYSTELVLDDDMLYRYAMHLYRSGEYYRAVTEYKRLLHFFPKSERTEKVSLQIGRSYMAGGKSDEAVAHWQAYSDDQLSDSLTGNSYRILYGISLLDLDRSSPYRLRSDSISSAMTVLSDVDAGDPDGQLVQDFVRDWENLPEPETKSPWLAGSMSAVIPGAGSLYTGRRMEALYAFFLTSLFWIATVDAVNNEDAPLTGLFGFFTLTFYGGNIYTAINSAHKYNDRLQSESLLQLRKKHGIWFIPETDRRSGRF